jgi:hypothetical protein
MAVSGLNGISGLQSLDVDTPEANPEEIQGNAADPRHGNRGEQSKPYSWESQQTPGGKHGPYGPPAEGFLDEDGCYFTLPAGIIHDDPTAETAPWTHAAPFPKNAAGDMSVSPDNVSRQRRFSMWAHSRRTGGQRNVYIPTMLAQQDQWAEIWENEPGEVMLTDVNPQMKAGLAPGGRGSTDRTQSFARQNRFGFDGWHMHRRYATGSVPGNYMWMRGKGRPLHKSLAGPARPPIGPDSPFAGQDLGGAFSYDTGAILQDTPTQYVAPPEPYVAPPVQYADESAPDWADSYGVS